MVRRWHKTKVPHLTCHLTCRKVSLEEAAPFLTCTASAVGSSHLSSISWPRSLQGGLSEECCLSLPYPGLEQGQEV